MTKTELKGLLRSKVFWLNTLTLVVEGASLMTGIIPPGILTSVVAIANIGLRVITKQSLSEKGQ
jgi:hypothetical protein